MVVTTQAMLAAGKAWKEIKKGQERLWSDWTMVIGPALMKARAEAMSIAQTNQPMGRGYNTAMGNLLTEYKLDDMGETSRAHILKIMEHYADVEEWRAKQKNAADLNHPSRVWTKFQRSSTAQDEKDRAKRNKNVTNTATELAKALEEIERLRAENDGLRAQIEELEAAREGRV
jgi:hypothetical protein